MKNLYQQILEKGKEAFKAINEITATRRDKRAFESAYDNAFEQFDKAKTEKYALYEAIGEYNNKMNQIIEKETTMRQAQNTMNFLKEEYMELFGVDLPTKE